MDSDIYSILVQEAMAHILASNNVLLSLEKEGVDPEKIKQLKSEIHTLKGDTRMLGFKSISEAAHRIEDFIQLISGADNTSLKEINRMIYGLLDAIENAVKQLPEKKVDIDLTSFPVEAITAGVQVKKETVELPQKQTAEKQSVQTAEPENVKPALAARQAGESGAFVQKSEYLNIKLTKIEELVKVSSAFPRFSSKFSFLLSRLREIEMQLSDILKHDEHLKGLSDLITEVSHQLAFYDLTAKRFQDELTRMKLVPLSTIFDYYPRLVRDVAESTGKDVNFTVAGKNVELDKFLVDNLKNVLLHLLRNAVDHGIETGDEREAAGKSRTGRVHLSAVNKGDTVVIEVSDDGYGLDIEKIRVHALNKKIITESEAQLMTASEITALIFQSGFSTKEIGTFSGRGVGMDVVAQVLNDINGEVKVRTTLGKGTTFSIILPLINSYLPVTIFSLGENLYGIPSSYIKAVMMVRAEQLRRDSNNLSRIYINLKNTDISLIDLEEIFNLGKNSDTDYFKLIICQFQDEITGFIVSDVVLEKKLIIGRTTALSAKLNIILGGVLLGTDRVIPVLNIAELFKSLKHEASYFTKVRDTDKVTHEIGFKNILVVEDSVVTRTTIKKLLIEQNFNVFEASNGSEALTVLEKEKIDCLFTDIEMPVMNGIELIASLKAHPVYKNIPVIVVSSYKNYGDKLSEFRVNKFIDKGEFNVETLVEALQKVKLF